MPTLSKKNMLAALSERHRTNRLHISHFAQGENIEGEKLTAGTAAVRLQATRRDQLLVELLVELLTTQRAASEQVKLSDRALEGFNKLVSPQIHRRRAGQKQ